MADKAEITGAGEDEFVLRKGGDIPFDQVEINGEHYVTNFPIKSIEWGWDGIQIFFSFPPSLSVQQAVKACVFVKVPDDS